MQSEHEEANVSGGSYQPWETDEHADHLPSEDVLDVATYNPGQQTIQKGLVKICKYEGGCVEPVELELFQSVRGKVHRFDAEVWKFQKRRSVGKVQDYVH